MAFSVNLDSIRHFARLDKLSRLAEAEAVADAAKDEETARQNEKYVRNSQKSFTLEQIAKYTGMLFGAFMGGVSFALSTALLNGPPEGLVAGSGTLPDIVHNVIGGTWMTVGIVASGIASIAATYAAYNINVQNKANTNEIIARTTAREIGDKLKDITLHVEVDPHSQGQTQLVSGGRVSLAADQAPEPMIALAGEAPYQKRGELDKDGGRYHQANTAITVADAAHDGQAFVTAPSNALVH